MGARNLWSDQPLAPPAEDVKLGWKSQKISLCDPLWVSRIEKKVSSLSVTDLSHLMRGKILLLFYVVVVVVVAIFSGIPPLNRMF